MRKAFVLETGVFPDRETVQQAIMRLESAMVVDRFNASRPGITASDWDLALERLLVADRIIVV